MFLTFESVDEILQKYMMEYCSLRWLCFQSKEKQENTLPFLAKLCFLLALRYTLGSKIWLSLGHMDCVVCALSFYKLKRTRIVDGSQKKLTWPPWVTFYNINKTLRGF